MSKTPILITDAEKNRQWNIDPTLRLRYFNSKDKYENDCIKNNDIAFEIILQFTQNQR